ncbi:30S ribosomal protein S18 [Rickettsia endosymbiont of Cardiosporidium cionae]|uniref:30S ribosomal protein S18 n=1 Tax=Rickettsia endosymbiont of Cardiosporidium cionae TaxID=2777155 RepID=UPI001896030F|nr:30S ribosomal protein S18 [Rickettsia endosymbiont of Cardiosporidium cionae]
MYSVGEKKIDPKNYKPGVIDTNNIYSSKMFFKKKQYCPLCEAKVVKIDYKDIDLLKRFISEGGRMLPSRITNICSTHQRKLKKSIKLSRMIALLPFVTQMQ